MTSKGSLRRLLRSPGFAVAVTALVPVVVAVNATAFGALYALLPVLEEV